MELLSLNLEMTEIVAAANEAFANGTIDATSCPYKILRETLKLRPDWRGYCTDDTTLVFLNSDAYTVVPELSNTVGAILHIDGTSFLPLSRPENA